MARLQILATVALIACAGAIQPAHAAPTTKTVAVSGNVVARCIFPTTPLTVTATVPNTGKMPTGLEGKTFSLPNVMCSGPSTIKLSATSLRLNPAYIILPPGQSQSINYTATASNWSPTNAFVRTNDTTWIGSNTLYQGTSQSLGSARLATITVTLSNFVVSNTTGSTKLANGNYSGTITVTLAPSS